jgi:hypothetical protein
MNISTLLLSFLLCISIFSIRAQEESQNLVAQYQDYTKAYREVVYLHLNKSTYIKGEDLGFTAYVFDKDKKVLSSATKNLYVIVEDEENNIISQKLIEVDKGIASNIISIDSTFFSGHYSIKAYTNWMRNFKEHNHFIESFKIIDPDTEPYIEATAINNEFDAQFLPEGGHLLANVINNVGVLIKDQNGYAIPNLKGGVFDGNNKFITEFKVNHLGIGKFSLLAELDNSYIVKIDHSNKKHQFEITSKVEPVGVMLSVVSYKNKAIATITANDRSLELLKGKTYNLALHNGKNIFMVDVFFENESVINKVFDLNSLSSGVQIFTLFNDKERPIAERLFFNYNNIDLIHSETVKAKAKSDSINIELFYNKVDSTQFHNLSISVLPTETTSYKRHHNMLSYIFLKPYVKGTIEQARYYFTDITERKKLQLDNLLITQGWSSYDWTDLFNPSTKPLNYEFEQGISIKANINQNKRRLPQRYMLNSDFTTGPHFFQIENIEQKYFYIDSLFPGKSDRIYLSELKNDEFYASKLYFQAKPNAIPDYSAPENILNPKESYKIRETINENEIVSESLSNLQQLNEVIVKANTDSKRSKIEKLTKHSSDRIMVVNDSISNTFLYFSDLVIANGGFKVRKFPTIGFLQINPRGYKPKKIPPTSSLVSIYIDDYGAGGHELFLYPSNKIDYILFQSGTYNSSGEIRIYTKENSEFYNDYERQSFEFPLSFNESKKYYAPKYKYYNNDFYKSFGVIDWKPNLKADNNGNIAFNISKPQVPFTLFIEGVTKDGIFISEIKIIKP